jgi:Large polyvalent protein-associated domain 7
MKMADAVERNIPSGKDRSKASEPEKPKPVMTKQKRKAETPVLTDDLSGKFLRVGDKLYRTSDDRQPIVRLEPDRLKTSNIDALPDIVRIAKANGWTSIRINGGDQFKRAAYLAAAAQGLIVENYTPPQLVRAEADRLKARLAVREMRREGTKTARPSPVSADSADPLKALSERFLRQTHEENARDPELRRAQSLVAQTIAIGRARYPDDSAKASKEVEARRQEIAQRIAAGNKIAVVQVRNQHAQVSRELAHDQAMQRGGRSR